jgi:hypothetical protein
MAPKATPVADVQRDQPAQVESTPELERAAALQRGVSEDQLSEINKNTVWVLSNREDDVVVGWEQDPRHPGGEAFIGGSAPDHVYKTPMVNKALYDQTARVVPEPARMIVHPISGERYVNPLHLMQSPEKTAVPRGLPGQPIKLGRPLDPMYYSTEEIDAHEKEITSGRREIPSEAGVPSDAPNERRT